ncbi:MAG: ABC transporter substrate-binding protein [Actinomycetota bacterium]|nr:ABC transporter substrate-binding protein [Actinomycetota bacterium]
MESLDRRTFLLGAVGTAGVLVLGACRRDDETSPQAGRQGEDLAPAPRPTLRLPGGDQGFPSPFAYQRGPGLIKTSFIYDTLVWKDSTGQLLPWLATHWDRSADARTYTFHLRENVQWHDGQPLTARDVAFTFQYFRAQTIPPQVIATPLPEIEEVRATGDRTVEFRLASPVATFFGFQGVGSIMIVPQHIWSGVQNAAQQTDPAILVGSGPYRLQSYNRGDGSYLYTVNDGYFLGRPFVSRLEYRPVGDQLNGIVAGELDMATASGVAPPVLAPFRQNPALEVIQQPPGNSGSGLWWNLARGGPLADARFRQACAHAINREDLVQRLHGGNADPGNPGWIPRGNPFHADVEQYRFDVGRANRLLDEAGYPRPGPDAVRQGPNGQPLRFSLLVATPPPPIIEPVVNALRAVGVEVTPEAVDTPAFNQRVSRGGSDLSIITFGGMNTDHAADYLRQIYSSKTQAVQHAQGYANPELDRLLDEQLTAVDESRRREIVARAQRIIAEDLPLLPLVYPHSFTIFNRNTFDQWYYTEGGVASTVPVAENKHLFVTGKKAGLEIRPIRQGS